MSSAVVVNTNPVQPNQQLHSSTWPPQTPPQSQVQFLQGPQHPPGVNPHYNAKAALWTGWIQFTCGIAAIIFGIISLLADLAFSNIGAGIWSGLLFYVTTGLLGIMSGSKKYDLIIAYLVMSIFCSIVSGVCFIIYSTGAAAESSFYYGYIPYGARLTLDLLLVFNALIEFVVSIIAAALCCSGNCCAPYSSVRTHSMYGHHVHPGTIITNIPQGTVSYTTSQPYSHPQHFSKGPMSNNFIQPMQMQQYLTQPGMQGQPMIQVPPWQAGAPTMQQSQSAPAPTYGRADGSVERPPPYEMYGNR